jgi:RNA polymerase sigma-70 factor (ECF subfamily)
MTAADAGNRADRPTTLPALVADEAAFRDWYDLVLPRVYRFLLARCAGDVALAEDLTQQTFVEAVRRRYQYDTRSDVVTWLCAIGRSKLVDHHRRLGRDRHRRLRLVSGWSDVDQPSRGTEERAVVQEALEQLTGEERLVLVLRHLDELPVKDIARLIGRSSRATDSLLVHAREAFRRVYRGPIDG